MSDTRYSWHSHTNSYYLLLLIRYSEIYKLILDMRDCCTETESSLSLHKHVNQAEMSCKVGELAFAIAAQEMLKVLNRVWHASCTMDISLGEILD